jgi:hypothetical protein
MIPAQRQPQPADAPQEPRETEYRAQDQRAEWHLDLDDTVLAGLAVNASTGSAK